MLQTNDDGEGGLLWWYVPVFSPQLKCARSSRYGTLARVVKALQVIRLRTTDPIHSEVVYRFKCKQSIIFTMTFNR